MDAHAPLFTDPFRYDASSALRTFSNLEAL